MLNHLIRIVKIFLFSVWNNVSMSRCLTLKRILFHAGSIDFRIIFSTWLWISKMSIIYAMYNCLKNYLRRFLNSSYLFHLQEMDILAQIEKYTTSIPRLLIVQWMKIFYFQLYEVMKSNVRCFKTCSKLMNEMCTLLHYITQCTKMVSTW